MKAWHNMEAQTVVKELSSHCEKGLSDSQARERLEEYGPNELEQKKSRPAWKKFLDQFKSFLAIVLILAAALAWAIGDVKDSLVILVVIFFNGILGFYQEQRAEKTLEALKGMLSTKARVRRDGSTVEIDAPQLVPGDIVLLEAGDQVPADGRILVAKNLEAAEAALTGESLPVGKTERPLEGDNLALGDRDNMLFMNTVVTKGRAEMIVTDTGKNAQMGKIAGIISESEEKKTPLQIQLDSLGKSLALIAGVIVAIIFAINFFRGIPLAKAAMDAVALAVAAVPEGLPAVVTVTLAIGMWRMAKNKAILKKLSSVETLGSTTVICTDKTGTLTMNQMRLESIYAGGELLNRQEASAQETFSEDIQESLRAMTLCSEASIHHGELIGDPTETALLSFAQEKGLDPEQERRRHARIAEIPFDSKHKFMATFHHAGDRVKMFVKGAPDVLIKRSNLNPQSEEKYRDQNEAYAKQGLRVLAFAASEFPAAEFDPDENLWDRADGWKLLGLSALMDPPRPEAQEAIELCHKAGIQVKMITGDHKLTASTIGKKLGLVGDTLLGEEIDVLPPEALAKVCETTAVFARVSPENKVQIVKALRGAGHVTAMTGDGVNDAPALKSADIGIAMGITGTAVTKEAAAMVLTDDNFATIVRAIKEGRVIYDNIIKFARFQISTNIGAILTVFAAALAGIPSPFTPIQLLWINIIMDGPPAMSLGLEKASDGLMSASPRSPKERILNLRRFWRLFYYGSIMCAGTLGIYLYAQASGMEKQAPTMAFTTFVFFQVFNVFNARAEFGSAFNKNFFKNIRLWIALVVVVFMQVAAVVVEPAQNIFKTTNLDVNQWFLTSMIASSILILEETRKLLWKTLSGLRS